MSKEKMDILEANQKLSESSEDLDKPIPFKKSSDENVTPDDVVFVTPTGEDMTVDEFIKRMKEQGLVPLKPVELLRIQKDSSPNRIKPEPTDIEVQSIDRKELEGSTKK